MPSSQMEQMRALKDEVARTIWWQCNSWWGGRIGDAPEMAVEHVVFRKNAFGDTKAAAMIYDVDHITGAGWIAMFGRLRLHALRRFHDTAFAPLEEGGLNLQSLFSFCRDNTRWLDAMGRIGYERNRAPNFYGRGKDGWLVSLSSDSWQASKFKEAS